MPKSKSLPRSNELKSMSEHEENIKDYHEKHESKVHQSVSLRVAVADSYYATGNYAEAQKYYLKCSRPDIERYGLELVVKTVTACLANADSDAARRFLNSDRVLTVIGKQHNGAYIPFIDRARSIILAHHNKFDEAITTLTSMPNHKDEIKIVLFIADIYTRQRNFANARNWLKFLPQEDKGYIYEKFAAESLLDLAYIHIKLRDFIEAKNIAEHLEKDNPYNEQIFCIKYFCNHALNPKQTDDLPWKLNREWNNILKHLSLNYEKYAFYPNQILPDPNFSLVLDVFYPKNSFFNSKLDYSVLLNFANAIQCLHPKDKKIEYLVASIYANTGLINAAKTFLSFRERKVNDLPLKDYSKNNKHNNYSKGKTNNDKKTRSSNQACTKRRGSKKTLH